MVWNYLLPITQREKDTYLSSRNLGRAFEEKTARLPSGQIVFGPSTKRKLCAFCKANQCLADYIYFVEMFVVISFEFLHSEIFKNCTNFREFFSNYAHKFYIVLREENNKIAEECKLM